jgi:hypothetical protein
VHGLERALQLAGHFEERGLPSGSKQLKYRNLRAGTEPDRETGDTDAAIDAELRAALFVPSAGVAI